MIWLFLVAVCFVAAAIAYAVSPPARVKKRASRAVAALSTISSELQDAIIGIRNELVQSARQYAQEIRLGRLREIPIEEVKKHQGGLRLQALHGVGIHTLADIQGWDAGRILQIRGVGPASARPIASIAASLIANSNKLPIPHPVPPFNQNSTRNLIQAIYRLRLYSTSIAGKQRLYEQYKSDFERRLSPLLPRLGFGRWVFSLGRSQSMGEAVTEAGSLVQEIDGSSSIAALRNELSELLENCRQVCNTRIDETTLMSDFKDDEEFYEVTLTDQLGQASQLAAPQATPALIQATPVKAVARKAAVVAARPVAVHVPVTFSVVIQERPSITDPAQVKKIRSQESKFWVPAGQDAVIGNGMRISGGLVYMGAGLQSANSGGTEPALINPTLAVSSNANYAERLLPYWPTYDGASEEARAAYLKWHLTGRKDPQAQIGYVFLFFYGLERRVLTASLDSPQDVAELAVINGELRRLLDIYGNQGSFASYASSLLDYLEAIQGSGLDLDKLPIPKPAPLRGADVALKVGLALHAKAIRPVSVDWALAWLTASQVWSIRSAFAELPEEFSALFKAEYQAATGDGLVLPENPTLIKAIHRTASSGFGGASFTKEIPLPDVTLQKNATDQLEAIGNKCAALLAPYRRYLSSQPESKGTVAAISQLPVVLWPENFRTSIESVRNSCLSSGKAMVLTLGELPKICPVELPLQKRRYSNFCANLGNFGLGIVSDVRFGADMPNVDDSIALFAADGLSGSIVLSDSYGWASLLLQLAAIVASAGSGFGDAETDVILNYINSELKVTPDESKRLMAHLSIYRVAPPAMTGIKRRLSKLNPKAREVVATFMIQVALADGIVEPAEVRILEQFFTAMGMDQTGLYSRLHNLGVDTRASEKPAAASGRQLAASKPVTVQFDMDKVAKLRSETAKLSTLLEEIFADDLPEAHGEPETEEILPEDGKPPLLPLDADHSALLEILIQRPEWTRQELEHLCTERGLMTDGAVETINEASFDKLDSALIEGEDPVTINTDLLIKETP
jgi:hypothetical protein